MTQPRPAAIRALRWFIIVWMIATFVWLGQEDDHLVPVLVLGVTGSLLVLASWTTRPERRILFMGRSAPVMVIAAGAVTGLGAIFLTTTLMFVKNVRHAHALPDYPTTMLASMLERAPVWAMAGSLTGLGLYLITTTLDVYPKGQRVQPSRFYLLRHGETDWNVEGRFQGQSDTDLNGNGRAQAQKAADLIATLPETFSTIYASPLKRTLQTAQPISDAIGLPIKTDKLLMEIFCGNLEGKNRAEINALHPGFFEIWRNSVSNATMPGGESIIDVQKRMTTFYDRIRPQHTGEAVIIVSHGAAIMTLLCAMLDWNLDEAWKDPERGVRNAQVAMIEVDPETDEHTLRMYNSRNV